MTTDSSLSDIVRQLKEKVDHLKKLSNELRSNHDGREPDEIQSDINALLNEMTVLHERASRLMQNGGVRG